MSQDLPLMPKATAVWLVDNTALTFDQIAAFCGLHPLEVKGIADGEVGAGVRGRSPLLNNELTREEIKKGEDDASYRLQLTKRKVVVAEVKRSGPRYTPVSRRQDRPNAILWLVRYHPELSDAQISRLVGTTKPTIVSIREKTHWNFSNLKPIDPVSLGLSSQIDLDAAVQKAAKRRAKMMPAEPDGPTLKPASETTEPPMASILERPAPEEKKENEELDAASVFASFSSDSDDADKND
jgi:hypothetical protein